MLPLIGQTLKMSLLDNGTRAEYQMVAVAYEASKLIATIPPKMPNPQNQLKPKSRISVKYRAPDGAQLSFHTQIINVSFDPPQLELQMPATADVQREQRREFVRVSVGLPVRIETTVGSKPKHFDLHMRDMSGGGIGVLLPPGVQFPVGGDVRARFTLPTGDIHIDLRCSVVRISDRNEFDFAVCSLKFVDIKESIRQKIIQYTFVRQRELSNLRKDMSMSRDA